MESLELRLEGRVIVKDELALVVDFWISCLDEVSDLCNVLLVES